jgi:acetyltransferase-like isoleucine patch superfamily enzyme
VVMPNNTVPEGTVIGALSFVPAGFNFQPWSVYAGVPVRFIRERNRSAIMDQVRRLESMLESRDRKL